MKTERTRDENLALFEQCLPVVDRVVGFRARTNAVIQQNRDDASQDVLLYLWRRMGDFDPDRGCLDHWFYRQAHFGLRRFVFRYRRKQRCGKIANRLYEDFVSPGDEGLSFADTIPCRAIDSADAVDWRDEIAFVRSQVSEEEWGLLCLIENPRWDFSGLDEATKNQRKLIRERLRRQMPERFLRTSSHAIAS